MDDKLAVAFIAASMSLVIALVGVAANFLITNLQVRSKINELTQTQLKDIVAKRIEVYPELWCIAQTELSDLERQEKLVNPGWVKDEWTRNAKWELDEKWAENLLVKLIDWHQNYGVFLSQHSFEAFVKLRRETLDLAIACNREKRGPTIKEFQHLDRIYYDTCDGKLSNLPLATRLKDDLGSYKTPFISYKA